MKPLIVLLIVFILSLAATRIFKGVYDIALSGRIAMSAMLIFTAIGHFVFTKGMSMMVPEFIPYKTGMVYLTGILEIAAAIGLMIPGLITLTAWLLILMFIMMLPANIYAAIKRIDYEKATFNGNGLNYLWFRVPLQIVFIAWTYLAC